MSPFDHIRFAGKSDIGCRRRNNEDSFGVFPSCGVFCVADGMGGGDDGEIASAATVNAVKEFCSSHPLPSGRCWKTEEWLDGVCGSVSAASNWIFTRAKGKGLKGCGSTFVGVCLDPSRPDTAMALHAGDSRLYLWHRGMLGRGGLRQITRDHSAAEMIGVKDERAVNPALRGMIMRAVGVLPTVEIERTLFRLLSGDRILLCSDGLTKMLPDKRIAAILKRYDQPSAAVEALISEANAAGGVDNVTAVLVNVGSLPNAMQTSGMAETEPLEREDDGEEEDESPTGGTGSGASGPATDDVTLPMDAVTPATHGDARRRFADFEWGPILLVLGIVATLAVVGGTVYILMRQDEVAKSAAMARDEQMNVTMECMKRQTEQKERQRLDEERKLRDADAVTARKKQVEDMKQIGGNVDLPRE